MDAAYPFGWIQRGLALASLERNDEALAAFTKATELDPAYSGNPPWARRAWALENLDPDEEALEAAEKAIQLDPDDAYPWTQRGFALASLELGTRGSTASVHEGDRT